MTGLEEESSAGGAPLTVARDSEVMGTKAVLDVWQRQGGVSQEVVLGAPVRTQERREKDSGSGGAVHLINQ